MSVFARYRLRQGVTLVELIVVLAVLGIMGGIAGLSSRAPHATPTPIESALDRIATARRQAIATGRDVSVMVEIDGGLHAVTAHADGRVLADSLPAVDALSGRPATMENDRAHL